MKKIILGGLILSSLFVGISYADQTLYLNTETKLNDALNSTYFELKDNFNFLENGQYKVLQWKGNTSYGRLNTFFWTTDGLYYIATCDGGYACQNINTSIMAQGYLQKYCIAPYGTRTSCDNGANYTGYISDIILNNQYANPDILQIYTTYGTFSQQGIFCFGYNGLNQNICLGFNSSDRTQLSNWTGSIGLTYNPLPSQLGTSVDNITNIATDSPFTKGGPDTEGGPISCINIKTQIMLYGNKYNTGMCYTNGLYFSGFTPIQTGKLSIFEVFPSFQDYQNMANTYNTYCHAPYTQQYCMNAMSGYNEGMDFFTNIENANNNNSMFTVEAEKLYQYCHLQLNFTEEEKRSECKDTVENYYATGVSEDGSNGNPFEGITDRLEDNVQIAVPTTGTVFDEFLDGDTRIVGITDRYGNFKDIYHKIMGLFKYRNTQQGIIPGYITAMIMLILLLAIIKK